jgi:OmpA family
MERGDMFRIPFIASLLVGLAVLAGAKTSWAQADCKQLLDPFNVAIIQADLRATITTARPILDSAKCPAATRMEVGAKVALAHVREAGHIKEPSRQLALLESGMTYGQPWKMMKLIGDLRRKVPTSNGDIDFAAASLAYQSALADIADSQRVPDPPSKEVIQELMKLANESRLLSKTFVRGDVLLTRSLRDVAVETIPMPVQFVRAYDEMGHTDPDGSDQYNLTLSLQRAKALHRYLTEHGYPGANIDSDGRGRREPLVLANPSDYSKTQIYQMLRRVEVKYR